MPRNYGTAAPRRPGHWLSGARVRLRLAAGVLVVCLGAGLAPPAARADYTDAIAAKDPRRQHMLLRRAAWRENDPLAQAELCRRYSSGGPGLADPVEAYVWCALASFNTALQGVSSGALLRQYEDVFGTGYRKRSEMYRRLRTAQRTEAYERLAYILSCRGASGFVTLGELYQPSPHENAYADYRKDLQLMRIALQDAGFRYFAEYIDFRIGTDTTGGEDNGYIDGSSSSSSSSQFAPPLPPLRRSSGEDEYPEGEGPDQDGGTGSGPSFPPSDVTGAFDDGSELPRNAIEALTFYILAERAGHPYAADLRAELEHEIETSLGDLRAIRRDAEAAADNWMPPFEVYANGARGRDGRYSDECPVSGRWEAALYRMDELETRDDQYALKWLQYYKGEIDNERGPATRGAVRDFQLANNWQGDGRLTDYQRSTLVRLAAVAGDAHSQETLGYMYACGIGVVPDEIRAAYWYRQGYEQGSALSAYNLGLLYQAENATASCLRNDESAVSVRKVEPDPDAAERYVRRAYSWGFRSIDPAFRRRFDLTPRAPQPAPDTGVYEGGEEEDYPEMDYVPEPVPYPERGGGREEDDYPETGEDTPVREDSP